MELTTAEIIIRLLIALLLGTAIGTERVIAGKTAGMRTYALVSMGAALFVVVSLVVGQNLSFSAGFDPLRMASQIIVGIGFLGAGMIVLHGNQVVGLTTASGIWVAAGIGMASGFGLYLPALIATILTLLTLSGLWFLEHRLKKIRGGGEPEEGSQM